MMRKVATDEFSHIPRKVGPQVQRRIDALGVGQKMQDLPEHLWHDSFRYYVKEDPDRKGGPNLRLLRLDPNKPSLTVTSFIFNKFVHPVENRFITPREAARLQGFPDEYLFHGALTSVQRQVGNAVPVQLSRSVAQSVLEHIEKYRPFGIGEKDNSIRPLPAMSLFSGAGGMDIGIMQAENKGLSFDIKFCVEIDRDCCETLSANFASGVKVIKQNVSEIDAKSILDTRETKGRLMTLMVGGPPCQSFSQAGKQKGAHDPRGKLILEFLRFVREIKPGYFIMENVSNLRGIAKGAFLKEIEDEIDKTGYNFSSSLLCAADYGAPQLRYRLFIIGVRKPYPAVSPPLPTHGDAKSRLLFQKPYVGVGEAFSGLPNLTNLKASDCFCLKPFSPLLIRNEEKGDIQMVN